MSGSLVARRIVLVVDEFARVLFHVDSCDTDALHLAVQFDIDVAVLGEGLGILGYLVALGEVRIEVVLPREGALPVDAALRGEAHPQCELDDFLVEHGQHPGHPRADGAGMAVRGGAEFRRAAAEDLRVREELGMDFQADDRFVFHYSFGLLFSRCAFFS
jgi:hypothetical protein